MRIIMENNFLIQDGVFISYNGKEESITIPEGVHTIGEDALKACVSLKRIVLPHSLRRIMPRAFKGCRNLRELEIPEGVCFVGDYAFHRCHSLEKIILPFSVEELGNSVFLFCDSLKEVHIPGVRRLGKQVFLNDIFLEKLVISRELDASCIRDVFTSCGRLRDFSYADGEHFLIPTLVDAVVGELNVPDLIHQIIADVLSMFELDGRCLVRFRTNLKHAEIPEGIEEIGRSCFFDKRGILSVTLPASLKEIKDRAFRNCINLEKITFRSSKVKIDDDAFKNCSSLKKIFMPGGREFSFQGITNSASGEIPELVKTIHQQILGNFRLCGTMLFKYLGNESRVTVPDGITAIAEDAFAGKEEMNRIILPDSLEEIGANAFRNCLTLQSAILPPSLKKIGAGAFENCVKLIRISLPDSIKKIESMTFRHCRQLKEINFGTSLSEIGEQAFSGCSALTEISLPESVAVIGNMAFYRCSKLGSIELSVNIQHIGNLAFAQSGIKKADVFCSCQNFETDIFSNCTKLSALVLHSGVRHIPDKLAFGCTALQNIILPETLESIGRNPIEKTPFLKKWKEEYQKLQQTAEETANAADRFKEKNNFLEAEYLDMSERIFWDGTELYGDVQIPHRFKIIAGGAFYGNQNITSVFLPDHVIWIGKAAFKSCASLVKVTWPVGVCDAQAEVFSGCFSLEEIEHAPLWHSIGDLAFTNCKYLKEFSLTKTKYIGNKAFWGCFYFRDPKIEHADFIGEKAFSQIIFPPLPSPLFPDCPPRAFHQSDNLLPTAGSVVTSQFIVYKDVKIPEDSTGIAPYTFFGNSKIETLELPESIRWIGEGAFLGCRSLKSIRFPSGICRIDARAFEKCTSLKKIVLCSNEIGMSAFAYCTSLRQATISHAISLQKHAFEGCSHLREFICPDNTLREISDFCFCGCGLLNKIDLSNVQRIGSYAFENCDNIIKITLSTDTQIEPHAFEDCGRLQKIHISGEEARLALREYAFSGCTVLKRILYEKTGESCPSAVWELKNYRDIHSSLIPHTVQIIFYSALSCFDVEKNEILCGYRGAGRIVKIPEGICKIQAEVFQDMPMLREIQIPESVTSIGARAFLGTEWLKRQQNHSKMVIFNGILLDGSRCAGEVTIPKEVHTICGWAFANGMKIQKIRFLSDRVKVEEFAFRNCIYLEEIQLPGQPCIKINGISDRSKDLPPLAKQIIIECLNCFKTNQENTLIECTGNISKLMLADGITKIGDHVLQESNLLTKILLPQTVVSIGKGAFANCKWLEIVKQKHHHLPLSQKNENTLGGIREIEDMAFSNCGMLRYVELSESFQKLGKRAFEHCVQLEEIFLPEGLDEIPDRAFFRCHHLKNVKFPSTLKRIGKEAFAFCECLEPPELPEGVEVGERAFVKSKNCKIQNFLPQ